MQCFTAFNFEFCPYNFTLIARVEFFNFVTDEVFIDCKKYSPTLLDFNVFYVALFIGGDLNLLGWDWKNKNTKTKRSPFKKSL
jgi:hypothetical protein